ncbi:ABC transporter ATP-binding protein [Bifidobacterium callimiconis]|uniref:ABC transporter ATP-binding protein n=1 Tax=Bifidobacterium callimiconis TaxID=2306973 RepID=A0A430FIK0_9BIFI|nr:energy-coupling factor ABC transporter ATP-binding protein [Bifidobacterium callimiconis]RSX52601.1 ABC transporter ATP-binding protein [Bifidobacterium callimiconis]
MTDDTNDIMNDAVETTAIETSRVTFRYGSGGDGAARDEPTRHTALHDVSLRIRPGECVVLCGRSGCGKTSYTRLVNGLIPTFFTGELTGTHHTADLASGSPVDAFTPIVGSVFQNPKTQYFNADTTSELAFPCENMGMPADEIRRRMAETVRRFGIEPLLNRSVFRLSGGQKQRLAVAAATMLRPPIMVLDEPTGNLDARSIDELHDMIARLKESGTTVLIAEHRLAWCRDLADRFVVFEHGRVIGNYPARDFLVLSPETIMSMGLRALDIRPYRAVVEAKRQTSDSLHRRDDETASAPALRTRMLRIGYGRRPHGFRPFGTRPKPGDFLRDVPDLTLRAGRITALMGGNGTGKSTLVRTLCGLLRPIGGSILWNGRPVKAHALTRKAFLVMQDVNYQLFTDSVREELMLGLDENDPAVGKRCERLLRDLDLETLADRHPMSLSGGEKQRTAIASALMCGKELIVLDEPTSGLDRFHMRQVGLLLQRLKRAGRIVVVVTHDEELAADWCDDVIDLDPVETSSSI